MNQPLLEVRNLRTEFNTRAGRVAAVNDVSLTLERGRVLGLAVSYTHLRAHET